MATDLFTDVLMEQGEDGIYDLVIDEASGDFATTGGLETAILCSLFSDRRAEADEVADPWKRRGWIGNLLADTPADNYGSGLWLYEQRRATEDVRAALRLEVIQSLQWLVAAGLAVAIDALIAYNPAKRRVVITVFVTDKLGGVSQHSHTIWSRTAATNTTPRPITPPLTAPTVYLTTRYGSMITSRDDTDITLRP